MSRLAYPRNVIWYLEARKWDWPEWEPQMGTGVVVWLQSAANPAKLRKFLLTCAHVVRGRDANGALGYGPVLKEILCWQPGFGHTRPRDIERRRSGKSPGAFAAEIFLLDNQIIPDEVPEDERRPALDWVLLEIKDPRFQDMDPVKDWADLAEGERLDIFGYPGGSETWGENGVVECVKSEDFEEQRTSSPGTLRLNSSASTAPGMSGGGIFNKKGQLVGIHRSQTASQLEFGAVRASTIRDVLKAKGWNVVQLSLPSPEQPAPGQPGAALELRRVEVEITANEVELDESGILRAKKPLRGLTLSLEPKGFSPVEIKPAETDESGVGTLRVAASPLTPDEHLTGHLLCESPPAHLAAEAPLVTSEYAAVKKGSQVLTLGKPLRLAKNKVIDVDVVPFSKRGRYYVSELPFLLDRAVVVPGMVRAFGGGPAEGLNISEAIVRIGEEFKLDEKTLEQATAAWVDTLKAERPAMRASGALLWQGRDLSPALAGLRDSVCAFVSEERVASSTGFVIAKDTVMTFSPGQAAKDVVNADDASDETANRWPLGKELWRDDELDIAIFAVKGVNVDPVPLAERAPFADPEGRKVIVLGYPGKDTRLPEKVHEVIYENVFGVKRVMPGQLIVPVERGSEPDEASALWHDATTAAGVSGGPVIDIETGTVIGIHRSGRWTGSRKENAAVPTWKILAIPEVREILEKRGGARLVSPAVSKVSVPKAQHLRKSMPYRPDFLGGVLVPPPRLDADKLASGDVLKGRVLDYVHYSLVMDERRGLALFVAANVDRGKLVSIRRPTRQKWLLDPRVPAHLQGDESLYVHNEWDKGHLAKPSALAWGTLQEAQAAYQSAFYFTNVAPQHQYFNQGLWSALEKYVLRGLHPESNKFCFFTGPVCKPDDIEYRSVRIPKSFWLLAVYENSSDPARPHIHAFLAAQYTAGAGGEIEPVVIAAREVKPNAYEISVDKLEQETGLVFDLPGRE